MSRHPRTRRPPFSYILLLVDAGLVDEDAAQKAGMSVRNYQRLKTRAKAKRAAECRGRLESLDFLNRWDLPDIEIEHRSLGDSGAPAPDLPAVDTFGGISRGEAAIIAALEENIRAAREQAILFGQVLAQTRQDRLP